MIFYPNSYFEKITDITPDFFKKNNIYGLLIDIDNTIITKDGNVVENLEEWAQGMSKNNIKLCILSNTNKKTKAQKMSKILNCKYIYFAKKPLKFGFKKAQKMLNINNKNIAVVGDQLLTDVLGANRNNMYSILVKPLNNNDIFVTKINRMIEKRILKNYFKNKS